MNLYRKLFGSFRNEATELGDAGGGADRGDDFTPTDDAADIAPEPEKKEPESAAEEDASSTQAEDATEPEKAKDDAKPRGKRGPIPLDRHEAILGKARAREEQYQARIKELEEQQARLKITEDVAQAEGKLAEMEEKYAQLLADGELKEAAKTRAEMRAMERALYQAEVRQEAARAKDQAKEEIRYDTTISQLEAMYPQLVPDGDEYDADAVAEVLALHKGLMAQGLPPSTSIQRAVKYVLGAPSSKGESTGDVTGERGLQRTQQQKAKNAQAAQRQPASTAQVGLDSDKMGGPVTEKSVMKMSQEDFAKLPEELLAKMRGDFV